MLSSNPWRIMLIALIAMALGACGSDGKDGTNGSNGRDGTNGSNGTDGANGRDGTNGSNGTNGTNGSSALVRISPEPAGANCAAGGSRVDYGQDTNGNTILDASEVSGTQYVCNGTSPVTYTIGGTVTGSVGRVVLQNNSDGYLLVAAAGSFTFGTTVSSDGAYAVSVLTPPPGQTCIVINGSGNATANVTNVQVTCTTNPLMLSSTTPADGAVDVDRTVAPSMVFSAALDVATVVPANVTLSSAAGNQPVALGVSGTQLTATPTRQLLPATSYTLRVSTGVRGSAGEQLASAVAGSFTTRDAQWHTPTLIETGSANAVNPQIAVDGSGNALAVWVQSDGARDNIWANRYTAGSGWGAATLIETDDAGNARVPQLAVDAIGNAMAVWAQSDGTRDNIWANRYTAGVGWGTATVIEMNPGRGLDPQIAVDASGNALAVWYQFDVASVDIWANRYTAGSGWGTARLLETDNAGDALLPQIAFDASGNALAVWQQFDGTRINIYSNRYTAGDDWGTATLVEMNDDGSATNPQIAVDANGNALAVWTQSDGARLNSYSNRYTAGSGWGTPTPIETDDTGNALGPQIAMDASGNELAVWWQFDGTRDNIWANRYTVGTGWSTATLIETNDAGSARNPQIAVDAAGNALAVWWQSDGTRDNIWANRYTLGTGWSTAALMETNDAGNARNPQIAVDANGNALAVWDQFDGTRSDIWARRFD